MKLSIVCTCLLSTLAATSAAEGEAHSCACEAEEFDFKINCADTSAMIDAMTFLKSNSCATNCSSPDCEKNYLIVQSHHDYCPEEVVPEEIEDGFHDYDEVCTACDIVRKNTEGAPDCPTPNCQDKSGDEAYGALVEAGCGTDCSSVACRDNFFVLRVAHDLCDHDTLSRASEEGLHDMEVSCAAQICNTAGGEDAQLVCDDHDHGHEDDSHDIHGDDSHDSHSEDDHSEDVTDPADSGAATVAITGVVALIGAALIMV